MRIHETQNDNDRLKSRIRAKDKVESMSQADWADEEVRVRRVKSIEKRLQELRTERGETRPKTPVYTNRQAAFTTWLGSVATEQDVMPRRAISNAAITYDKISHVNDDDN